MVISNFAALPYRLQQTVRCVTSSDEFLFALKTAHKPLFELPTLWLIFTTTSVLLCKTHRTRGLWARHSRAEINAIRIIQGMTGALTLEIILTDQDAPPTLI